MARCHGISPQQLFTWRQLARKPLKTVADVEIPILAPAVLDVPMMPVTTEPPRAARRNSSRGAIEPDRVQVPATYHQKIYSTRAIEVHYGHPETHSADAIRGKHVTHGMLWRLPTVVRRRLAAKADLSN